MRNTEIDTLLRTWIPSHELGVAVALLKEDQMVHCQGYRLANDDLINNMDLLPQAMEDGICRPAFATYEFVHPLQLTSLLA